MNSTTTVTTVRSERRTIRSVALLGSVLLMAPWATAEKKKTAPQAVIAGGVFQDTGGSLPGVKVVVVSESDPRDKREAVTDRRGEFAVRVPGGARYRVVASAKGFETQEKTVEAIEGEKVTKNFLLSADKDLR